MNILYKPPASTFACFNSIYTFGKHQFTHDSACRLRDASGRVVFSRGLVAHPGKTSSKPRAHMQQSSNRSSTSVSQIIVVLLLQFSYRAPTHPREARHQPHISLASPCIVSLTLEAAVFSPCNDGEAGRRDPAEASGEDTTQKTRWGSILRR